MRSTIKNNYEFRRLYSKGKSAFTARMAVYCRKNNSQINRLGITVSTKIGKAVHRNRIRRRFREIFRLNRHLLVQGYDIVLVARVKSRYSTYRELDADYIYLMKKLGLYLTDDEKADNCTD